ncbi:cyclase family protein [Mariniphaga sp.]|uniref:cyclase family protein n=1 Tax=Mariniphaga sp. TaxID=1954475 RepID=UPI003566D83A
MKLYDLSHLLNNETPVFPGMVKPRFQPAAKIEKDGYRETRFEMDSHTGTHIDAPAHMLENGKTLDQLPVDKFSGKAVIISVPQGTEVIEKELLLQFEEKLQKVDFVLFKTGWSKFWGTPRYFNNFPALTSEAVEWLLNFSLKGIGFDIISADPMKSTSYPNHFSILGKECIIIENLTFPDALTETEGEFFCFPIPYENADGSPVRAVFGV